MSLRPSTYDLSADKHYMEVGQTYEDVSRRGKEHVDASVFAKIPVNPFSLKSPGVGGGVKFRHDDGDSAQLKGSVHFDGTANISANVNKRIYTGKDRNVDVQQGVSVTFDMFGGGIRDIRF